MNTFFSSDSAGDGVLLCTDLDVSGERIWKMPAYRMHHEQPQLASAGVDGAFGVIRDQEGHDTKPRGGQTRAPLQGSVLRANQYPRDSPHKCAERANGDNKGRGSQVLILLNPSQVQKGTLKEDARYHPDERVATKKSPPDVSGESPTPMLPWRELKEVSSRALFPSPKPNSACSFWKAVRSKVTDAAGCHGRTKRALLDWAP